MAVTRNRFSLVIFDLDGTLIDAFEDIAAAANFIRGRNEMAKLSVSEVKEHVGYGARYLVEGVLGSTDKSFIDDNLAALVGYYEGLEESNARIYDGVVNTLEQIKKASIQTAIASNKPHSVTVKVVEKLGLNTWIDIVRGEDASIRRKPAPDVLIRIMKDVGSTPEQTLMVGDSEIDIDCAKAAGVQVAAVSYGQHDQSRLEARKPDFMLNSMPDLLPILGIEMKVVVR